MTANILWCGGEDIDFPNGVAVKHSAHYVYGRESLAAVDSSITGTTQYTCIGASFPGGAVTSCWLRFLLYCTASSIDSNWLLAGLTVTGKSGGDGLYVSVGSPSSKLRLVTWNGSSQTQLAIESGSSIGSLGFYSISMQVISYGASATVNVYVGSNLVITYTGDIRISSMTNVDRVGFTGNYYAARVVMSEFIVSDSDTRNMSLATLPPNAAGDANAWTGAYTDIDETTVSDADLVYTNAAANDAQFNLADSPAGTWVVLATKISARATKSSDAAIGTLKLGFKSGGTVDVDAGQALTTSWATYERLTATINGATPTTSDLTALQLNLRSAA